MAVVAPEARQRPEPTFALRLRALVSARGQLVVLIGLLFATLLLPGPVPPASVYVTGLAAAGGVVLHAIALVLVYRSSRVINFAQIQMGALGGALAAQLSSRRQFLVWIHTVCEPCLPAGGAPSLPPGVAADDLSRSELAALSASGWMVTANTIVSLIAAIAAVSLVVFIAYHLVIKRFASAPRLVLTVVTIALTGVLAGVQGLISALFDAEGGAVRLVLPVDFEVRTAGTVIEAPAILRLVAAVLAVTAIAVVLRRTLGGTALRSIAESPARAETLGIPVSKLTGRVWIVAALLSTIVSFLDAAAIGVSGDASAGSLIRPLAAMVFAGLASLPVAAVAAVVIAVFDQAVLWGFDTSLVTDAALLIVIVVVLLLLHQRRERADTDLPTWTAAREVRPTPAELRVLPSLRSAARWGAAAVAVVVVALPWVLTPSQTVEMATTLLLGIVLLSLLVLTGWAGQISLGQFGFVAIGAWVGAVLGWPLPLGLIAAALAGGAAALLLGIPALRLRGLHLAVATLAFAAAVPAILLNPRYLAKALPTDLDRPRLLGLDFGDDRSFYYLCLVFLVATTFAVVGMKRSRTGRALIACRDNEAAAQGFGIDLVRARLTAFAASGVMAAIAGVLFAYAQRGVEAATYRPGASIQAFLVAILGGLGSVAGPLLGVAYVAFLSLVSLGELGALFATGTGTILLLIAMPGGISQGFYAVRDAILRRLADRHKIDVPSLVADGADRGGRAPILPKKRGGSAVFVPTRYRLDGNWAVPSPKEEIEANSQATEVIGG